LPEVPNLSLLCCGDLDELIGCGGAGLEPVGWQQGFQFFRGGITHELVEDPLEPGEEILAVAAELLDEGVDDGAAPAGVLAADEHPILVAELGGTDGVFGEIVVELDLAVEETGFEMRPLLGGVGKGLAKRAFGRDAALVAQVGDEPADTVVVPPGFQPAGALAIQRPGTLFAQPRLDLVDATDLMEDPGGDARVVIAGFVKLPPDVGEAGDGDDFQMGMAGDECLIGAQAVALQVALEGGVPFRADEDGVETGVGAAFVPVQ